MASRGIPLRWTAGLFYLLRSTGFALLKHALRGPAEVIGHVQEWLARGGLNIENHLALEILGGPEFTGSAGGLVQGVFENLSARAGSAFSNVEDEPLGPFEAALHQVREHIGVKLVIAAMVFEGKKRRNFAGNHNFGFTGQIAQITEENRANVRHVFACVKIKTAALDAFDDAGNGVEQRIDFNLRLKSGDFGADSSQRTINPYQGHTESQGDTFGAQNQLFALTVESRVAGFIEKAVRYFQWR